MIILGINAYHPNSSACLVNNGKVLFAIEEERINRIKHWSGLPVEAIKLCLQEAGMTFDQVDHITISKDPKAKIFKKLTYTLSKPHLYLTAKNRALNALTVNGIRDNVSQAVGYFKASPVPEQHFIEHHISHNSSAFYDSSFEESALLSVDGMGDFSSTMLGYGSGHKLKVYDTISYPHSLGYLYTAMTQFLGFRNFGDEYKVMGLSAYGSPNFQEELKKLIRIDSKGFFSLNGKYFSHFNSGGKMNCENGIPSIEPLFTKNWNSLFGPGRMNGDPIEQHHKDLAASVQYLIEEILFRLCENVYNKTKSKNLCLSGGVAQNSAANGKILENTQFDHLFIPPASHDAGTAIGSALYYYHHISGKPKFNDHYSTYTGSQFDSKEIKTLLKEREVSFQELEEEEIMERVSEALVSGNVIGWFQGRMEFGPRALGNRSILVDPRRSDVKDLLNRKIKRRERFRPFAASVLADKIGDYFDDDQPSPYMERVLSVKKEQLHLIPAVVHTNHTCRVQTVDEMTNHKFFNLIRKFYDKTDVPMLLNTSFNENEPIVNTPEQALECFLRTDMDLLVLENIVVKK